MRWPAEFSKVHRLIRLFESSHVVCDLEANKMGLLSSLVSMMGKFSFATAYHAFMYNKNGYLKLVHDSLEGRRGRTIRHGFFA